MTPAEFKLRSCESKEQYNSEKAALNVIKSKKKKGYIISSNFGPYKCRFCDKWHLGHSK